MAVHINIDWNRVSRQATQLSQQGLQESAEFVLNKSKEHCPHDTGMLENSGNTEVTINKAQVFYDTPYAARLHEHPEYNFQGKGQGKWLERALIYSQNDIINIIQNAIRGGF